MKAGAAIEAIAPWMTRVGRGPTRWLRLRRAERSSLWRVTAWS